MLLLQATDYYYYNHFIAFWILSRNTQVSQYQKGKIKTNLDFLEQETVSSRGITSAICKSAPLPIQITTPAPNYSFFTGWMPFLPPNQQLQSTEGKATDSRWYTIYIIAVTLNILEGQFPIASLFHVWFFIFVVHHAVPVHVQSFLSLLW